MKHYHFLILCSFMIFCISCNNSGNKTNVNAQQKPRILVMPSDQMLEKYSKIYTEDAQGKTLFIRDYPGYLLADNDSKFVISTIQSKFTELGYPLNDLEQTLKQINDQEMIDEVDGIKKDAKTILLTSAKPDIILELDYRMNLSGSGHSKEKKLTYTLKAIDAFTNKVVATAQAANFDEADEKNATGLMSAALDKDMGAFTKQINAYFEDIVKNGRDITVRVTIEGDAAFEMSDECLNGDSYTDYIIDYMKANSIQGAYNMNRNTETELYFTNVRIKTLNDDGSQYSAYDFARELIKNLNKKEGIKAKNNTQGLGDAVISIKGM